MNPIINYFKDKEASVKFLVIGLLAIGTHALGKSVVRSIFVWSTTYGWFGFDKIKTQMDFCFYPSMIISTLTTILLAYIVDKVYLRRKFDYISRNIFWVLVFILIMARIIGNSILANNYSYPYAFFNQIKYLICY